MIGNPSPSRKHKWYETPTLNHLVLGLVIAKCRPPTERGHGDHIFKQCRTRCFRANLNHARDHVTATLHHRDGSEESVESRHTFNAAQIAWFKAGSALNMLRS